MFIDVDDYLLKKKKSIIQTGTEPTFGKQGC